MTDQLSADAMSCVIGQTYIHTPAIDKLAEKGLRFTQAYCAHPLCVPSRTSMFTGRYPHETGVLSGGSDHDLTGFPCIGSILGNAGYDTGYVGKWHLSYPIEDPSAHGFRFCSNNICNGADLENFDKASLFLREQRNSPFFLVVSYNNPHNICEWARGARGRLPDGVIKDPPALDQLPPLRLNYRPMRNEPDAISLLRRSYQASPVFPVADFSEREWREYQWAYYRMIECVDNHIAALLDELESTGLSENTAIIFVSDHGDAQGAHAWNQKTVLEDESSRVPCLVSYPKRIAPGVSHALIQTGIDFIPTLCDLAGVKPLPAMHGQSMLRSAAEFGEDFERPYIVTQTRLTQGAEIDGVIPKVDGRMVRSKQYKYCVYDKGIRRESLVDIQTDPGECVNLAVEGEFISEVERHRHYLEEFSCAFSDPFPVIKTAK
ncbi:MAG: sulfatase-like hydrolase/transferase [Planctomycetes bacterium]|nr:sulfatase-like hydrolase/transferase [Planctomycetota bacterium]